MKDALVPSCPAEFDTLENEMKSRASAGDPDVSETYFLVLLNEPSTDTEAVTP